MDGAARHSVRGAGEYGAVSLRTVFFFLKGRETAFILGDKGNRSAGLGHCARATAYGPGLKKTGRCLLL